MEAVNLVINVDNSRLLAMEVKEFLVGFVHTKNHTYKFKFGPDRLRLDGVVAEILSFRTPE